MESRNGRGEDGLEYNAALTWFDCVQMFKKKSRWSQHWAPMVQWFNFVQTTIDSELIWTAYFQIKAMAKAKKGMNPPVQGAPEGLLLC